MMVIAILCEDQVDALEIHGMTALTVLPMHSSTGMDDVSVCLTGVVCPILAYGLTRMETMGHVIYTQVYALLTVLHVMVLLMSIVMILINLFLEAGVCTSTTGKG